MSAIAREKTKCPHFRNSGSLFQSFLYALHREGGGGGGSFPHYQGVLNSELSAGQESTVLTNGKRPNLPTIFRVCGFQFYYQDITIIVKTILLKISVQTQNVIWSLLMNVRFFQTQQGSQQFWINHYKYHMRRRDNQRGTSQECRTPLVW